MTKAEIVDQLWIKYDWWKMGYSQELIKSKPKKWLLAALKQEKNSAIEDLWASRRPPRPKSIWDQIGD